MTTTVEPLRPRTRRGAELLLLLLAIAIVLLAWVTTDLNRNGTVPANIIPVAGGFTVLALAVHLVLRWKAAYADPVLLPITTVLNGLGLVMIHRLDLARGKLGTDGDAYRQLIWTTLAVVLAIGVLIMLRDHRLLRRYTFVTMAAGFVLLLLPLVPGLGRTINGSQIWISIGPLNFQPGEFAKIGLVLVGATVLAAKRKLLGRMRHVIVPQAVRIVIPPVTNDFIALFKDTSVCSVITLVELTKQYSILANSTGGVLEFALATALLYMAMSLPLSYLSGWSERMLARGPQMVKEGGVPA